MGLLSPSRLNIKLLEHKSLFNRTLALSRTLDMPAFTRWGKTNIGISERLEHLDTIYHTNNGRKEETEMPRPKYILRTEKHGYTSVLSLEEARIRAEHMLSKINENITITLFHRIFDTTGKDIISESKIESYEMIRVGRKVEEECDNGKKVKRIVYDKLELKITPFKGLEEKDEPQTAKAHKLPIS